MSAVVEKMMPGAVFSSSANARYEAELKAITKKHGFKNFAEYEAVAASISLVMAAIDSQTKVFTNPPTAIQQELEDVTAAKNIPNSEKKKIASEPHFGAEGGATYPISDQRRVVQKYYDKIDVTTIATYDGYGWRNSSVVRAISD
jgi:hypothetical protein